MAFDYLYAEQSEQFSFYRIPKVLMTEERFAGLSTDAKILYGLCLDRVALSRRNGWSDESGRVFIYYTIESVEHDVGCAVQKAVRLLKELEDFGLIERRKRGQGKPSEIYVKNFIPEFRNSQFQNYENHSSGTVKTKGAELRKSQGNNTELNNTEKSKTDRIVSAGYDSDARAAVRSYFEEKLCLKSLKQRYPHQKETLDGIVDILTDTVCSEKKQIRVMGENMPANVVKSQFMKLDASHIEYVMDRMHATSSKIRNIRQYLMAALYNAPSTIDSYYQQEVQHDLMHQADEQKK